MKKYLILLSSVLIIGCASDEKYDSLNRDPNGLSEASAEGLFVSSTKTLFDRMESTNVNSNIFRLLSQYWTETTYIDEANYDLNTRNIPANHFNIIYRDVLFDLKDAKSKVSNPNQIAMISVLEVYAWQVLVDTFGDVPYSEALQLNANPTPKYDDAKTIYQDLITRINAAIAGFSTSTAAGFTSADKIYGGDISKWLKFANSLKLKLAMRIADVTSLAALSQSTAQSAVDPSNGGVITSNADNATLAYEANATNANPLWFDLVQSGRSDFVIANTVADYMNTLVDPRRPFYFDDNLGAGVYTGGPYGDNNAFSSYTHIGDIMHTQDFRGVLMDASEVHFMLAEAAERGYSVGGTTESHYNAGITACMEDWGVASADITTYLANPAVAYTTATGTWKQKIGFQYWLAMYNRGFEGWYVYRKFDAPTMNVAASSGLPVPVRFTYPLSEQTLNGSNYEAAAAAIGGDLMTTKLFWDVN